jgi:hypothetical protein
VEILIEQNREFRDSLVHCRTENLRLQGDMDKQNAKMRQVIESLKAENSRLRTEVSEGLRLLRWSGNQENKVHTKKTSAWKNREIFYNFTISKS